MFHSKIFLISFIFLASAPLIAEEPVADGTLAQSNATDTEAVVEEGLLSKKSPRQFARPTVKRQGRYLLKSTLAEYGEPVEKEEGETTSRIANEFVDKLTSSEYGEASKYFSNTMKDKMPTRFLRKNWVTLLRGSGDFVSKGEDWVSATDVYQVSHIPILLADNQYVLRVVVSEGKVSNFLIGLPWTGELSEDAEPETTKDI